MSASNTFLQFVVDRIPQRDRSEMFRQFALARREIEDRVMQRVGEICREATERLKHFPGTPESTTKTDFYPISAKTISDIPLGGGEDYTAGLC